MEIAYRFINHTLDPNSALELANQTGASIFNLAALDKISPDIKSLDWVYPKDMSKMHTFKDYDPKIRIWMNEAWLEIQMATCQ